MSVYHEEEGRIMRCVYDSANSMIVGYVELPETDSDEDKANYKSEVDSLVASHKEWALTAKDTDVITVTGVL